MRFDNSFDDSSGDNAVANLIADGWAGFAGTLLILIILLLLIVNPKADPVEPEESALYVTSVWDVGLPFREDTNSHRQSVLQREGVPVQSGHSRADFDLWVAYIAPEGGRCELVGYPSQLRKSRLLKLDEDDRGWSGSDIKEDVNREVVGARSLRLPAGQYIVSVHLYSNRGDAVSEDMPMLVDLKIEVNKDQPDRFLIEHQIPYTRRGMEYGVQFMVNEEGQVVETSVLAPSIDLRIATASGGRNSVCNMPPAASSAGPQSR
ncbi:MAG: hypothetical protein OSB62_02240 [Alphaproteobacteria bacterium]|nr:hypothetical protein [Alphaproteobacteria bacterium]